MNQLKHSPIVSIVMTTYGCADFVSKTIDSILNQTLTDIELIIVDDCSPDNTKDIINAYTDPRINFIQNEINIGVSRSRNKGIAVANGRYIAPCDHDDISMPDRLEKQVAYLEKHEEIALLATEAKIYVHGKEYKLHQFDQWSPRLLHWILYFRSPIVHSSICFRKEALIEYSIQYHPEIKYADDYDLFHQFAHIGNIAILNEELVIKEEDGDNASFSHYEEMTENGQGVLLDKYQHNLGLDNVNNKNMQVLWHVINEGKPAKSRNELMVLGELINDASLAFFQKYRCTEAQQHDINEYNSEEWLRAVVHLAKIESNIKLLSCYTEFPLLSIKRISFLRKIKLYMLIFLGKERLELIRDFFRGGA